MAIDSLPNCCHKSYVFSIRVLTWPSIDAVLLVSPRRAETDFVLVTVASAEVGMVLDKGYSTNICNKEIS